MVNPVNFALDFHLSLKAERLFDVGFLHVTNSMLYGLLSTGIIMLTLVWAAKRIGLHPGRGLAGLVETLVNFVIGMLEAPLGSRELAVKFAPYFGVFFFFVIGSNLLGLLPFVGSSVYAVVGGEKAPLLRPFTADLNGTIAMSIFAMGLVQYLSIREQGIVGHLSHYLPKRWYNPMDIFMSFLEVISEFSKLVSLALRLFLNTAVGEILIAVFSSFIVSQSRTPLLALPMVIFEVLIAAIQAYVYLILCASYLGVTMSEHREKLQLAKG